MVADIYSALGPGEPWVGGGVGEEGGWLVGGWIRAVGGIQIYRKSVLVQVAQYLPQHDSPCPSRLLATSPHTLLRRISSRMTWKSK